MEFFKMLVAFILYVIAWVDANPGSYSYVKTHHHHSYSSSQSYLAAPPGKRPSCAGESDTFCTTIDYYPTEVIENLVKRYSFDFKTLLQDETMDTMSLASPAKVNVTTVKKTFTGSHSPADGDQWWTRYMRMPPRRHHGIRVARQVPNQEKLCPTTSSFIAPRAAINTRGTWMYVVNLEGEDQRTSQLVRSEKCATTECSGLCQVPPGFTSSCSQQFVQKRLVALNANGESLYSDTFWFPHCCICQIKSTEN